MAGQISAATVSAQRLYQVLDSKPHVQNRPNALPLKDVKGRIAFENVCFSYEDECIEPVLEDINLVAEPGQTVAILGATLPTHSMVRLFPCIEVHIARLGQAKESLKPVQQGK